MAMIPGEREPGLLTRFAVSPDIPCSMVDVTIDAATIADRQREGGGAARKRRQAGARPIGTTTPQFRCPGGQKMSLRQ
jgi:hypothetical protein